MAQFDSYQLHPNDSVPSYQSHPSSYPAVAMGKCTTDLALFVALGIYIEKNWFASSKNCPIVVLTDIVDR